MMRQSHFLPAACLALLLTSCAGKVQDQLVSSGPVRTVMAVDSISPDAEMEALLAPYRAEVARLDDPIGESAAEMGARSAELCSFVSDVMLLKASEIYGEPLDGAFTNSGGVRATLPEGPVSYNTIAQILPFDNTIVVMEVSGELAERLWAHLYETRNVMYTSGISFTGRGDELLAVEIAGEPFDPTRTYKIVTNNFLASGGGNMELLLEAKQIDLAVFQRDVVAEHVKELAARGERITVPTDLPRHTITPEETP